MPKKTPNRTPNAAPRGGSPASADQAVDYRTAAEDKLWAALHAHPNATAAELALAAGIGRSTATKILGRWAGDGSVTRTAGSAGGGRRTADRWAITGTGSGSDTGREEAMAAASTGSAVDDVPAQPIPDPGAGSAVGEPAGSDRSTGAGESVAGAGAGEPVAAAGRLAPGALRGLVEDFLADHPDEEFTPGDISRKLNRSAGAIANALVTLTGHGVAELVCERPKKYRAVADTES